MTRQIASKFSILYTYEKQKLLSYFFISYLKKKNIKKELWIFYAIKYGKFCHILPGHFIKYKTLISEQWVTAFDYVYISAGANMWLPWMVQKEIIYASLKNVLHNEIKTFFLLEFSTQRNIFKNIILWALRR